MYKDIISLFAQWPSALAYYVVITRRHPGVGAMMDAPRDTMRLHIAFPLSSLTLKPVRRALPIDAVIVAFLKLTGWGEQRLNQIGGVPLQPNPRLGKNSPFMSA